MPLNKTSITLWLVVSSFFISTYSFAQDPSKIRTHAVIPYHYKTIVAPPGMIYIPGGTTNIKYDQSSSDSNSMRMVSLTSFFIDKTEVTNQQYRQFTEWIMDSIAIVKYLKDDKYFYEDETRKDGAVADNNTSTPPTAPVIDTTLTKSNDTTAMKPAVAMDTTKPAMPADTANRATAAVDTSGPADKRRINWNKVNHEKIWNPKNKDTYGKLAPMLDENGNIKKELMCYTYKYVKSNSTADKANQNRKREIKTETLNVYPDENCWSNDLTNSQTEMYTENYFNSPPFDDYPVVGVNWSQARAFCYWRSSNAKAYMNMPEYMKYYSLTYTLPSEAQWIYAAQGYYDMIVADDSTLYYDTAVNVVYPTDSTVTPHDSAWVAQYVQKVQGIDTTAAATGAFDSTQTAANAAADSARNAARDQRREERAARMAKKKKDERFNYYMADFLKFNKYGGMYGDLDGKNPPAYDPNNPPIDSSPVHFDPNGMLSNFKQDEGDYWEDGSALSLPVMSYAPNEFGLYNMEGNVAEWVLDAYSPSTFSFVSDLNPVLLYDADSTDADAMKRKVVRGGSFVSNAKSLNPYYRDMELQNIGHCFIGFRCIMQAPEILRKNVSTRNKTMRGNPVKGKLYGARILPEIH